MHTIIVTGNVGKDPEERFTATGKKLVTFPIAVSIKKDKTIWYDCNIWEESIPQFEGMLKFIKKGSRLMVNGALGVPETYKNKNDETVVKNKIQPAQMEFLPSTEKREPSVFDGSGVDTSNIGF